jgi:hypothetical protein
MGLSAVGLDPVGWDCESQVHHKAQADSET